MLNLIRRDLIIQKKMIFVFVPYVIFFIFMDTPAAIVFLVASVFIPFNAYAYDEKAEVNILLNSLPYTRKEIIAARYLGAVIYMGFAVGFAIIAMLVLNKSFTLTDIAIGAGLFVLFCALAFPLFYILKPGHITTVLMIVFISSVLFIPRLMSNYLEAISTFLLSVSTSTLYIGATVIGLTLYGLSWIVTSAVYERKAF